MINLITACFICTITIFSHGFFVHKFLFVNSNEKTRIIESALFGVIALGLLAVIINFLIPLNKFVGSFVIIFSFFLFYKIIIKENYRYKIIKLIIASSIMTFLLIYGSNINRPDAGLYHLPYVSILHDSKIMFGISNVHSRFGMISIIQYLSAIFNNHFFILEFLTIPLATIFSFFIVFLISIFSALKKNLTLLNFIFFILVVTFYSFSRYSNYGNDAPTHIYFFLVAFYFLISHKDKDNFYKILIISSFLITLKPFMLFVFIIPIVYFFKFTKNTWVLNRCLLFSFCILFFWVLKNIITTGCIIYPVTKTCFSKLNYVDKQVVKQVETEGEAWSKDVNNSKVNISFKEYNKVKWMNVWLNNHFKVITEKTFPIFIFLIIIFLLKMLKTKLVFKNNKSKFFSNNQFLLILLCLIFSVIWFLKFPIYRYGMSFLVIFIFSIFCFILTFFENENSFKKNKFFFSIIVICAIIVFSLKNLIRITNIDNIKYSNFPWPKIYTLKNEGENVPKKFKQIMNNNKLLYYYTGGTECMYSLAPCTNYLNKNIKLNTIKTYKVYSLNNK